MGKGKGIDFGGICKVRVFENIHLGGTGKVRDPKSVTISYTALRK